MDEFFDSSRPSSDRSSFHHLACKQSRASVQASFAASTKGQSKVRDEGPPLSDSELAVPHAGGFKRNPESIGELNSKLGQSSIPGVACINETAIVAPAELSSKTRKRFVRHMSWIPRENFTEKFDVGIPIEAMGGLNEKHSVLLLHTTTNKHFDEGEQDPIEATEQCQELSLIVTDRKRTKRCVAIMENWGGSSHIYRFWRDPTSKDSPLAQAGRFHSDKPGGANRWQKPPPRDMTKKSWILLRNYLNHYTATLEALEPIAKKVSSASTGSGSDKGAIIVMVSNFGQADILFNFVCAAHRINYDLSKVLLFPMDEETNHFAKEQLGLQTFFAKELYDGLIPSVKHDSYTFGDGKFAQMMMGKVYSVQMVNDLGHDILFQDLDVVPLRPNILDYFYQNRDTESIDLFFQYDRNRNVEQAPFSANSGFYFAKCNQRTNYFFSMLARMGDLILKTGSHQQVLSILMSEHIAIHGLKVKVMGGMNEKDADLFPTSNANKGATIDGWHMHRSKWFMDDMKKGIQNPYIFHVNWNKNGKEKIDLMKASGHWFVKDTCHSSDRAASVANCCLAA
eukprot:scaffold692_cov118-Cylindrotheca_fusiformis.AAC.12